MTRPFSPVSVFEAHVALTEAGGRFVLVTRNRGGWTRAHVRWGRKAGGLTDAHRVFRSAGYEDVKTQFDLHRYEGGGGRQHLVGHLPSCLGLMVVDIDSGSAAAQREAEALMGEPVYACASRSRGRHLYYRCDPSRVDWEGPGTRRWVMMTGEGRVAGDVFTHSRLAFLAGERELIGLACVVHEGDHERGPHWEDAAVGSVMAAAVEAAGGASSGGHTGARRAARRQGGRLPAPEWVSAPQARVGPQRSAEWLYASLAGLDLS